MSSNYLPLAISNMGFLLFVIATFMALVNKLMRKRLSVSEILYRWYSFFSLGVTGIYMSYMHAVDPLYTAPLLGWLNSPFQFQIAVAFFAFGMLAIFSFKSSYGFRLAAVLGNACWLWGDAMVLSHQMMLKHGFNWLNAFSWFWLDLFVPLILLLCLVSIRKTESGY